MLHGWFIFIIVSSISYRKTSCERVYQYSYNLKKACDDECGQETLLEAEKKGTMICDLQSTNIMSPCVNDCLSKKNRMWINPNDTKTQRHCWCEFCRLNPEKNEFFCKEVGAGLSKQDDCDNTVCDGKGEYVFHHHFCLSENGHTRHEIGEDDLGN